MSPFAIFGNTITPFDERGEVDERRLREHLRFMARPHTGIYLCGQGSGEGDLLSEDEKVRIYQIAADELGGAVAVAASGIGLGNPTSLAVRFAQRAQDAGVDAIQIVGPRPGPRRPTDAEVEAYIRTIIEAVECDVHVANNVALTGYSLPFELIHRVVTDYPRVTAVLLSEGSVESLNIGLARLTSTFNGAVEVRAGLTAAIASVHALRGSGLLCFEPNVAPDLPSEVWQGLDDPGDPAFNQRFGALLRLNMTLSRFGNPRSLKAALRVLGHDMGEPRRPYLPLTGAALRELSN
jgi:4-hydroxy-tetrahydrodipicolinate synthase